MKKVDAANIERAFKWVLELDDNTLREGSNVSIRHSQRCSHEKFVCVLRSLLAEACFRR